MKPYLIKNTFRTSLIVAGMSMATSIAQADGFDLSEKLSVTGFIDMSTTYSEVDAGGGATSSSAASGLDQFEMDFMYDFGEGLTAQVDLQYTNDLTTIESGYFVYQISDELSFKAGRFLAYSGWEAAEPTGLFQYSASPLAPTFYGGYQQGTSLLYGTDTFEVAATVANSLVNGLETDSKNPGIETMVAVYPSEALTFKAFYLTEEDTDTIDVWGSYGINDFTFALEYAMSDYANDSEASGILAMVNYAMGDAAVTFRYHALEAEDAAGTTTSDTSGITFAPSYAVTENLLIVAEYRLDTETAGATDVDTTSMALEALITY